MHSHAVHCVNWLELLLLCPRVVFDVNMLGAWLSFVVVGLSAQQENSYCVCVLGGGCGGGAVMCMCVCVCVRE